MCHRRAFLASLAITALAGCLSGDTIGTAGTPTVTADDDDTPTEMPTGTADLDLREANVVEIAFDGVPGEAITFDVTLFHDDDGEDGYANWWQIEALDSTQLGRRELLHAHSTAPFTRSATIDVPADVTCVVVRGHDQTHGYGGQVVLVNLETGATRGLDQGPEPASYGTGDCP